MARLLLNTYLDHSEKDADVICYSQISLTYKGDKKH